MNRLALASLVTLLTLLPLLAGCSSGPPQEPPRPLVLAILPAPELNPLDPDADPDALLGGDFLLEVATQLSAEARLDLCFVPGPLLAKGLDEDGLKEALLALADGLGQIAAPVFVGLTAQDEPRVRLLEALQRSLRGHPGEASVWGEVVLGWRPVALEGQATLQSVEDAAKVEARRNRNANEGAEEDEDEAAREAAIPLLVVRHDGAVADPDPRVRLRVVRGAEPALVPLGPSSLELRVPPLGAGLYGLCVLHPDRIELEWRSVDPTKPAPERQRVPWPGRKAPTERD